MSVLCKLWPLLGKSGLHETQAKILPNAVFFIVFGHKIHST